MNALELKMCDIQGRLFELSSEKQYNSLIFIKTFMKSTLAKELDSKYNSMQWAGEKCLLEELEAVAGENLVIDENVFPRDVLYWCGYFYRYWHFYSGDESGKILKKVPIELLWKNYVELHSMEPVAAVEKLQKIS